MSQIKALITAGPTHEPIDPVRFIGNRSSGKQGYAIASALTAAGIDVTLISGPTNLPDPEGVKTIRVQTAREMLAGALNSLPADIFIAAAAVSDWSPEYQEQKIKKRSSGEPPKIMLTENPDIVSTVANHEQRPKLVIGFAAETENLLENAKTKLKTKNCDWVLANDISQNVFGADENHVYLITSSDTQEWPRTSKIEIANRLTTKITEYLKCL